MPSLGFLGGFYVGEISFRITLQSGYDLRWVHCVPFRSLRGTFGLVQRVPIRVMATVSFYLCFDRQLA